MKNILDLSSEEALEYFMNSDNYFTYSLPKYISFQPILDYVRLMIDELSYDDSRLTNCHASDYEDVNYKLLDNKDSHYLYRPLTVANPYLYYLTVKLITKEDNWTTIKERFVLYKNEHIEVCSIPLQTIDKKKVTSASILNWWENLEQRTIELSLEYKYMFKTDITNCYPSIYTHAVDWAISGRDVVKRNKHDKCRLGAQLDSFIRGFQYGQTNGIPQGSRLFDLIAELVLGYCDYEFSKKIYNSCITNYKILRYRDDYRIFSNSKEDLDKITLLMQDVFSEFNFQMNSSKTIHTEKIVRNAIKNDKLDYFQNLPLYHIKKNEEDAEPDIYCPFDSYYKELYYILLFAEKHPNSGIVLTLLSNFNARIRKKDRINSNVKVMIALIVEITLTCVRAHQISMSIISYLLTNIENNENIEEIISNIKKRFNHIPNTGVIQIWLQRITYNLDLKKELTLYNEAICNLVAGKDIKLWNFSWLKPNLYFAFPYESICDAEVLEKITPSIEPEELFCFDPYYWNVSVEYISENREGEELPF